MKVPISWLEEFVDIDQPIEDLADRLTLAGLEVEEIQFVGLPIPEVRQSAKRGGKHGRSVRVSGLAWDPDKIVVGAVLEVMPHPDADRLVLCRLDDGVGEHVVLTGAPNLFPLKGKGPLDSPLKVAYAREGAELFDGHQPGWVPMVLKRAKIRGVESYSMACSEKELGISDDHEGVIILDGDAPVGTPLAEYMGDAVLDIVITPNTARDANILGVAREAAVLMRKPLKEPSYDVPWTGDPIEGRVGVEIGVPELNPRFVAGLIEGVTLGPSPYWLQYRLHLAGMRPINNIVDATNYVMLEIGEPLHAFDYDVLVRRAGDKSPKILTRLAGPDEQLTTLDGVDRALDDFTVLVADERGALSIAGVMGGAESEVSDRTRNILLEGAAWNYINIRQTLAAQRLSSEAAYRFSRGVHPAMAERGVRRGLTLMQRLAGGQIAKGLVDEYPKPVEAPSVEVSTTDVVRWLGVELATEEIADILRRLEFAVEVDGQVVRAVAPDHRLDIGSGVVGVADLMEEVARVYGYDRIPETQISDTIPPLYGSPSLEREERIRDLLVELGLQEVVTYRLTTPEREARIIPELAKSEDSYIWLANPIASDRVVMRRSLLASVLEVAERNARLRDRLAVFEIGPVYIPVEDGLPDEPPRLAIVISGPRRPTTWQGSESSPMDFYDLKGIVDQLLAGLHIEDVRYVASARACFHPGKCAQVFSRDQLLGTIGELHPTVAAGYELGESAVLAGELDLATISDLLRERFPVAPTPTYPAVLEDLAVVVDEEISAESVQKVIREAGGPMLREVNLFDLYRGEQIAKGKKSLAYSVVYQADDRTLTDEEVAGLRKKIILRLKEELGGELRTRDGRG
jgi:phenylalanyl-tRNA synthetase beta chain